VAHLYMFQNLRRCMDWFSVAALRQLPCCECLEVTHRALLHRLEFASLDHNHVMTVARGPLHEALPTFIQQAGWAVTPGSSDAEVAQRHRLALSVPVPASQYKHIAELLGPGK
jgi:hypothetical protein